MWPPTRLRGLKTEAGKKRACMKWSTFCEEPRRALSISGARSSLRGVFRAMLAALALALPRLASAPAPPREVGVASALEKLRPGDPLPGGVAIDLAGARGQCESAQIGVRPARALSALAARASPLEGPSLIAPALYRVGTVELARPSGPEGERGPWPDPLIPERDAYFDEARRAFPVAVPARRLQAVWVEICVPLQAKAGRYRGEVRLSEEGRDLASIPVTLTVWPFTLPSTPSFPVTFGLATRVGTRALGRPDEPELARALAAALLRHRVTPHGLSSDPPWGRCTARRCELDWRSYDAEVAPILDGTLVSGARGTFAEARVAQRDWDGPDRDVAALLRSWREHFEARGWADRLWLYTLDEPKAQDLPELARRARIARSVGVRVFVTSPPVPELSGLVDAYAPNLVFFERGAAERPVNPVPLDLSAGGLFWYASCLSHGCDEMPASGPTREWMVRAFRGWPGYEIDRPGAAVLAMGWLAYRERTRGELYYATLEAWKDDPWKNVRAFAGNGDGTLLYPGFPARLGGTHPFPVESIRLKLAREAIEDRELFSLAERSGLGALARTLAASAAKGMRSFAREPGPWLRARRELGEALAARQPSGASMSTR